MRVEKEVLGFEPFGSLVDGRVVEKDGAENQPFSIAVVRKRFVDCSPDFPARLGHGATL
jgi:hypothetical protein